MAALRAIEDGAYADIALRRELSAARLTGGPAARATALVFGTTRLRRRCDYLLRPRLSRPLQQLAPPLRTVLRLGVYELLWAREAEPAAVVHGLVDLARASGGEGCAKLANAVLRRVAGEAETLRERPAELAPERDIEGCLVYWESHPRWLVRRWLATVGPERALARCRAGNREPSPTLRVNRLRSRREALLARLQAAGVEAEPGLLSPYAVHVRRAGPVESLPGWREGWFTVQDEAAMWVAAVSGAGPGCRAIDLCAAPGGKTTQLAEQMAGEGTIIACDRNAQRLARIQSTAARLGLGGITLCAGDARRLAETMEPADVVVLDAPCSGTGTLARRADLRWRLDAARLAELTALQTELLDTAVGLVRPGGVLVYATCSLEPEENQEQLDRLAERYPTVVPDPPPEAPPGWDVARADVLIEPSEEGHDGMYIARRRRLT